MRAIFAGTFDPFTCGHRNIVERTLKVFDSVTVAVANSKGANVAVDARVEIARMSVSGLNGVTVQAFDGLLTDFVASQTDRCVLVRGIRSSRDHEYERELDAVYKSLTDVDSVYFMTKPELLHVSSTVVRELAALGAPLGGYVVPCAAETISKYY